MEFSNKLKSEDCFNRFSANYKYFRSCYFFIARSNCIIENIKENLEGAFEELMEKEYLIKILIKHLLQYKY
jgi:hypothetical protein